MIGNQRSPVAVLLLTLVTCGIYYIYWLYVTSKEINEYLGEEDLPPVAEVLLFFFTGSLYGIFWDWKTAKKIARMQAQAGIPSNDNSLMFLIFDLLGAGPIGGLGLVTIIVEQSDLNQIWKRSLVTR